jgi:uncharacterized protein YndB with AHSA1/START domain
VTTTTPANREFTHTWSLDAPPAQVYRAWTDPRHLDWFYNPEQPAPTDPIEVDLRVGGAWRLTMVIDADTRYPTGGIYLEIVPDQRLVFAWGATDGWPALDADRLQDSPQVTVTFEAEGGRTALTVHVEFPKTLADDGLPNWWKHAETGWHDTVDRLVAAIG